MKKFLKDVILAVIADPEVKTQLNLLIVSVISDPTIQQVIKDLLGQLITERILPLVPVAVGAAVKAAIENVPGAQGIVDLVGATDGAIKGLNDLIPDFDWGIKALDDLQDFWRPKNG